MSITTFTIIIIMFPSFHAAARVPSACAGTPYYYTSRQMHSLEVLALSFLFLLCLALFALLVLFSAPARSTSSPSSSSVLSQERCSLGGLAGPGALALETGGIRGRSPPLPGALARAMWQWALALLSEILAKLESQQTEGIPCAVGGPRFFLGSAMGPPSRTSESSC